MSTDGNPKDAQRIGERDGERDGERIGERIAQRIADVLATVDAGEALSTSLEFTYQLPWLAWFPNDFYGSPMVEAMNDRQQNRYRRLLDKSWQMEHPCFLPADLDLLASFCRCYPLDFEEDKKIILNRFELTEDGQFYYQPRLLREYLKALPAQLGRRSAARQTNQKRRERTAQRDGERDGERDATVHATEPTTTTHNHIKSKAIVGVGADAPGTPEEPVLDNLEVRVLHLIRSCPKGEQFQSWEQLSFTDRVAVIQAVKDLARILGGGTITRDVLDQSYDHILKRTLMYRAAVATWPKPDRVKAYRVYNWFKEARFDEDATLWDRTEVNGGQYRDGGQSRGSGQVSKAQQRRDRAQQVVKDLARDVYSSDDVGGDDPRAQVDGDAISSHNANDLAGTVVEFPAGSRRPSVS